MGFLTQDEAQAFGRIKAEAVSIALANCNTGGAIAFRCCESVEDMETVCRQLGGCGWERTHKEVIGLLNEFAKG